MNSSKAIFRLTQNVVRATTRKASNEVPSPRFKTLKQTQARFGVEDGTLVHLKAGPRDRILYVFTTCLVLGSTGYALATIYSMIAKQ